MPVVVVPIDTGDRADKQAQQESDYVYVPCYRSGRAVLEPNPIKQWTQLLIGKEQK